MVFSCGTYAISFLLLAEILQLSPLSSFKVAFPLFKLVSPSNILIIVLLPSPEGPTSAIISLGLASILALSNTTFSLFKYLKYPSSTFTEIPLSSKLLHIVSTILSSLIFSLGSSTTSIILPAAVVAPIADGTTFIKSENELDNLLDNCKNKVIVP